ncbi:MAG: thioredoxin family protein, partial [Verrucomicrobia subdivision 3 bacterium]|nr:thioredoxin family protein [Limisphaerales bacterium]
HATSRTPPALALFHRNIFKHPQRFGIYIIVQRTLVVLFAALLGALAPYAQAAHTRVALVLSAVSAKPGDTVWAGVRLQMDPGWHTYWKNPGDSGGPTTVEWQFPSGVTCGEIQWPLPEKLTLEGLTTYIFHDEVTLLVPVKLAVDLKPGPLELKANVSWLECDKLCQKGDARVTATLEIAAETKAAAEAALIETARGKLPKPANLLSARGAWEKPAAGDARPLILEWSTSAPVSEPDFFPDANEAFEVESATEIISIGADQVRLRKGVKKFSGDWPGQVSGVLIQTLDGLRQGFSATLPIAGNLDSGTDSSPKPPATLLTAGPRSLWQMLLYAFIGGLILNIMPCVLPVIALKILGFVGQAKAAPGRVRRLGLIYAAGVGMSFLVLAGLVIGVKAAGHQAGWGMQFSNPQFIIFLTTLVTLLALNLFGVFEVSLGGGVMGAAGGLASQPGAGGAFFNGVLATVLATPCTAPFLGVALGFAFAQPAAIIALFFLTIGAGLAAPYVVLSWQPAWLKFLPKPGAWMENFKIAMGFPMLGTAVWLASLTGTFYGERTWWLGVFLVFIAAAAWVFGHFVQRGEHRRGLATATLGGLLLIGYLWPLDAQLRWRSPEKNTNVNSSIKHAPEGYGWLPWSPEAVAKARASGKPVIVDFTAKWCLTCNLTVKPALESKRVIQKLGEIGAVALLADYTESPPEITQELKRFDRAGVPMVLIYSGDSSKPPSVLPEPLSFSSASYSETILEGLSAAEK